jgi:hypothetical protein
MKSRKSPWNILIGLLLILLSIGMGFVFFELDDKYFTNTRAGSVLGVGLACVLVFVIGVSRIIIYFWSIFININAKRNPD